MDELIHNPRDFSRMVSFETNDNLRKQLHEKILPKDLRNALASALKRGYKRDAAPIPYINANKLLHSRFNCNPSITEYAWVVYERNFEYLDINAGIDYMTFRALSVAVWDTDTGIMPYGHEGIRVWSEFSKDIPLIFSIRSMNMQSPFQFLSVALINTKIQYPTYLANGFLRKYTIDDLDSISLIDTVVLNFPCVNGFLWPKEVFEDPVSILSQKPPLPPKKKRPRPELTVDVNVEQYEEKNFGTPISHPELSCAIWKRARYGVNGRNFPGDPLEIVENVCNPHVAMVEEMRHYYNLCDLYLNPPHES